jgi:hypothetical protein
MTLLTPPGHLQGGTYTALLDRMYLHTVPNARDMSTNHTARQGFYPDRFPAYSNPAGMDVTIGPGAGLVQNTFASDAGDYIVANPSNLTVTPAGSSPTQNRNDIIGFQVKDNFYDSSGLNSVIPAIIQGANSAGTPVDPALPSSFIPIVRAVVNAGVTSPTLQDMRAKTVPSAAILPIESGTERTALGSPHAGFTIWRNDSSVHEVASGAGTWRVTDIVVASGSADLTSKVTTPFTGQLAYRSDLQKYQRWTGSAWLTITGEVMIARHRRITSSTATTSATGQGVIELWVSVITGRLYMIESPVFAVNATVSTDIVFGKIVGTTDGSAPSAASATLAGARSEWTPTTIPVRVGTLWPSTITGTLKLWLVVGRTSGSGTVQSFADGTRVTDLLVWDMGLDPGASGTNLV